MLNCPKLFPQNIFHALLQMYNDLRIIFFGNGYGVFYFFIIQYIFVFQRIYRTKLNDLFLPFQTSRIYYLHFLYIVYYINRRVHF